MCGSSQPDGPVRKEDKDVVENRVSVAPSIVSRTLPTKQFLDELLKNPEATAALTQFLQSEFCIENFNFIQKVTAYREEIFKADVEKPDERTHLQEVREKIVTAFMLPASEQEVTFILILGQFTGKVQTGMFNHS